MDRGQKAPKLQTRHESQDEHRKGGLHIGSPVGKKNAGNDHVKYKIQGKGVLQTTGEIDQKGQQSQVDGDLQIGQSVGPNKKNRLGNPLQPSIEQDTQNIVRNQKTNENHWQI